MNHKRKKRKIKTVKGYLPGDGPRGNSKKDQTKQQEIEDIRVDSQLITGYCTVCGLGDCDQ